MRDRRALSIGITTSILGHLVIVGLIAWLARPRPVEKPKEVRIEVSLVKDVAPKSAAPDPASEPPAPAKGEPEPPAPKPEPPKPVPPKPVPPKPVPPKPVPPKPKPVPAPAPKPKPLPPKPAPPKPKPVPPKTEPAKPNPKPPVKTGTAKPTGRLDGLIGGSGQNPGKKPDADKPPAQSVGEAKKAITVSLAAEILPQWRKCLPRGFDVQLIETDVDLYLNQDGSLSRVEVVEQRGVNDSNKPQAPLVKQCAVKAVQLAAPFASLPPDYYSVWKVWPMTLKAR